MSDMHDYGGWTLKPLEKFVESQANVNVVAVTGDCFRWSKCEPLPDSWNEWPQRLRLSVPGNHDGVKTFILVPSWNHTTPYACLHAWDEEETTYYVARYNRLKRDTLKPYVSSPLDVMFVGLDTSKDLFTGKDCDTFADFDSEEGSHKLESQLDELDESFLAAGSALVVLSHRWPQEDRAGPVWKTLMTLCGQKRPLLILCGHEHNRSLRRPRWSGPVIIGGVKCYRSQVYSEENTGNLITWDGNCFACEPQFW